MRRFNTSEKIKKIMLSYLIIIFTLTIVIVAIVFFVGDNKKGEAYGKDSAKQFVINDKEVNVTKSKLNKIKVYRASSGKTEEMDLEVYIIGVVSAEMPANFDKEALKAQAVAARTFAINKIMERCSQANGADICDTVHCQAYLDKDKRMESWDQNKAQEYYEKIKAAVNETAGEVVTYNGSIIKYPQYFAISAGKTEDSIDVFNEDIPYLKSVPSKGEEIAPKYKASKNVSINEFINIVNSKYPNSNLKSAQVKKSVSILSRTVSGAVKEIQLGCQKITGVDFRKIFELNSSNFSLDFNESSITITCFGYGHDVGMSQWGANIMAKSGHSYREILNHYYSGTNISKLDAN
ncbi:stage II sporulation protein D [Inconstantimicrobium mannanitabidum]|uniref:Stage II sporulation protein D n=1 Tax=Inconstantimicrobium mannanitabidum TaxID=1604901 RepID=A0ACB5R7L6_9CLOT|nr:stage II sporulation protein D [Clostridium sp. TW13]GKX64951.1 stage II sporulation protein D [Clostridium sp. TW13]